MTFFLLVLFLGIKGEWAGLEPPQWPLAFQATFTRSYLQPLANSFTNITGALYYNFTSAQLRIDLSNGRLDRYCGFNGGKSLLNTPCSQVVGQGQRYLVYPELGECCVCCSAQDGCGVLDFDWLRNATFVSSVDFGGREAFQWVLTIPEQTYTYYETAAEVPEDRVMLGLWTGEEEFNQYYDVQQSLPVGYLSIPEQCLDAGSCSMLSSCSFTLVE